MRLPYGGSGRASFQRVIAFVCRQAGAISRGTQAGIEAIFAGVVKFCRGRAQWIVTGSLRAPGCGLWNVWRSRPALISHIIRAPIHASNAGP
jgi:hypothetical protein